MALFLTNEEVRDFLTMDECLQRLEEAYIEAAYGRIAERSPSRTHTYLPGSEPNRHFMFKSVEGGIERYQTYAVRLSSDNIGLVTGQDGIQRRKKLPLVRRNQYLGVILLFSTEDGCLKGILQDAYVNQMLVGAAQGLGIKYLTDSNLEEVSILGAGWFARSQLEAASRIRKIRRVRVFSPTRDHRENFAREMSERLQIEVRAVGSAEKAVRGSPLVVCVTSSVAPVFFAKWIEPGMTVVSLAEGDEFNRRREVDDETILRSNAIVHSFKANALAYKTHLHELCVEKRILEWEKVIDLRDVVGGKTKARKRETDVVFFKVDAALGMSYAALGAWVLDRAGKRKAGKEIDDNLYLEDLRP